MKQQYKVVFSKIPIELLKIGMPVIAGNRILGNIVRVEQCDNYYSTIYYSYKDIDNVVRVARNYHCCFNYTFSLITCPKIGKAFGEIWIDE